LNSIAKKNGKNAKTKMEEAEYIFKKSHSSPILNIYSFYCEFPLFAASPSSTS
jgi:hypothetical protein